MKITNKIIYQKPNHTSTLTQNGQIRTTLEKGDPRETYENAKTKYKMTNISLKHYKSTQINSVVFIKQVQLLLLLEITRFFKKI